MKIVIAMTIYLFVGLVEASPWTVDARSFDKITVVWTVVKPAKLIFVTIPSFNGAPSSYKIQQDPHQIGQYKISPTLMSTHQGARGSSLIFTYTFDAFIDLRDQLQKRENSNVDIETVVRWLDFKPHHETKLPDQVVPLLVGTALMIPSVCDLVLRRFGL